MAIAAPDEWQWHMAAAMHICLLVAMDIMRPPVIRLQDLYALCFVGDTTMKYTLSKEHKDECDTPLPAPVLHFPGQQIHGTEP